MPGGVAQALNSIRQIFTARGAARPVVIWRWNIHSKVPVLRYCKGSTDRAGGFVVSPEDVGFHWILNIELRYFCASHFSPCFRIDHSPINSASQTIHHAPMERGKPSHRSDMQANYGQTLDGTILQVQVSEPGAIVIVALLQIPFILMRPDRNCSQ